MRNYIKEHDAHFSYPEEKAFLKTFNNTTQLGRMNLRIPMIRYVKLSKSIIQCHHINETDDTNTWFYTTTS